MNDINISLVARLLSERDAAKVIDVAPATLAVWRSTGRYDLPYLKIGRKVRYQFADLQNWLEQRKCKPPR